MEALKGKIHDTTSTFNSAKKEAEKNAGKLKGGVKDIFYAGNKEIKGVVSSVKKGSGSTSREVEKTKNKCFEFLANICEKICQPFSKKKL